MLWFCDRDVKDFIKMLDAAHDIKEGPIRGKLQFDAFTHCKKGILKYSNGC